MIRYGPILKTECGSNKSGIEAKIQKQENDKTSFFLFLFTTVSRGLSVDHKKRGTKNKKKGSKKERDENKKKSIPLRAQKEGRNRSRYRGAKLYGVTTTGERESHSVPLEP